MTQFPLRGGPPICEWNRQDLAKNKGMRRTTWDKEEDVESDINVLSHVLGIVFLLL